MDLTATILGHFPPPEPHFSILLQLIDEAPPKEGIFRVPGSKTDVDIILNYFQVARHERDEKKIRDKLCQFSLHTWCSTLKAYLASVSLICSSHEEWAELLEVLDSKDLEQLKYYLENRIAQDRRRVLYRIIEMIEKMTHHPEIKMNAQNMAVVFAPTLTDYEGKDEADSSNPTAALLRYQQQLATSVPMVVTMIEHKDYLFESVLSIPSPVFENIPDDTPIETPKSAISEQYFATKQDSVKSLPRHTPEEPEIDGNPDDALPYPSDDQLTDVSGRDLVNESLNVGTNTPPQDRHPPEQIELKKPDPIEYDAQEEEEHMYNNLEELEEEIEEEKVRQSLLRIEQEQAKLRDDLGKVNVTHDDIVAITTEEFSKMMNVSNISLIVKEELEKELKRYTHQWNNDVKSIKRDVIQHKKRTEEEIHTIAEQSAKSVAAVAEKPATPSSKKTSIEEKEIQQLKEDMEEIKAHFAKYDAIISRIESKQEAIIVRIDEIGKANSSSRRAFESTLDTTRSEVRKQDLQIRELTTQLGTLQTKFEGRAKVLDEYYPTYQLNGLSAFSKRDSTSPQWNLAPPARTPPRPPVDEMESRTASSNGDMSPLEKRARSTERSPDREGRPKRHLIPDQKRPQLSHAQLTEQLERLQKKYLGDVMPSERRYTMDSAPQRMGIHKPLFGASSSLMSGGTGLSSAERAPRFGTLYSSVSNRPSHILSSSKRAPVVDVGRPHHVPNSENGSLRRVSPPSTLATRLNANVGRQSVGDMETHLSSLRKELNFETL